MTRSRLTVAAVVLLVVAVLAAGAVAGVQRWRDAHRSDLERAMAMAPADSQRLCWTDWAGVREELDLSLSADSPTAEVTELIDRGFEADLTSTSALAESAALMHGPFGFSPATVDWELFTQSEAAAAVTLGLPDSADFDSIADRLAALGYAAPSSDTGVWLGGPDLLAQIGTQITPELTFVALDAEEHVIVTSDTTEGAKAAMAAASKGGAPTGGLGDVVVSIDEGAAPLSGAFYTGDQVCARPLDGTGRRRRPGRGSPAARSSRRHQPAHRLRDDQGPRRRPQGGDGRSRPRRRPAPTPTPARCWPPARLPGRAATSRSGSSWAR